MKTEFEVKQAVEGIKSRKYTDDSQGLLLDCAELAIELLLDIRLLAQLLVSGLIRQGGGK